MTEPIVTDVPEREQYEIVVDGVRAGLAAYLDIGDGGGQRVFHHTEIDKTFGGRGLGSTLIAAALDDTRSAGKRIVPTCSFVEAYVAKHPEYADVVDPVTPQVRAALENL
ncbi:MAG: GNAT family N-acetyltransferase [Mycobacterium sp.]